VRVKLASKISAQDCVRLNLGYLDPKTVNVHEWKDKEDEGVLFAPKAGKILYRLKNMKIKFFVIMGVAGCGKTGVGKLLSQYLGWDFYDADNFHLPENIKKMAGGIPLTDSDRDPWLASLHELILSNLKHNQPCVLACSALKERYRQQLLDGNNDVQLVYLKGSYELIWSRISMRKDHYMKPKMLQSQFDALEEPANALTIDISGSVDEIVREILKHIE